MFNQTYSINSVVGNHWNKSLTDFVTSTQEFLSLCFARLEILGWPGANQIEPPSPLISWVNSFPCRFINRAIFLCNAVESHEWTYCLVFDIRQYYRSFLRFHWLFSVRNLLNEPFYLQIYSGKGWLRNLVWETKTPSDALLGWPVKQVVFTFLLGTLRQRWFCLRQ